MTPPDGGMVTRCAGRQYRPFWAAAGVVRQQSWLNWCSDEQGDHQGIRDRGRQELHYAERLAATHRRAPVSPHKGTPGGDIGGRMGGTKRRAWRKLRLPVRQTAAARD